MINHKSKLVCPYCSHEKTVTMPSTFCQYFLECTNCKTVIKAKLVIVAYFALMEISNVLQFKKTKQSEYVGRSVYLINQITNNKKYLISLLC